MSRHILALAALAVALHAGGPRFFALLAYRRSSILGGQVWRLLTTYLVLAGTAPLTRAALGGQVAVAAHAYGALSGLLAGLALPVEARPASGTPAASGG